MTTDDRTEKVRLKRVHYLNGLRKAPGSVIRVAPATAEWLLAIGAGDAILEPKQTARKAGPNERKSV